MTTRISRTFLITTCALSILALAGCQSSGVTGCAGFVLNNLSAAGTTALIEADRDGARRVIGNDRNFKRRGC